jgi:hypothetical protein
MRCATIQPESTRRGAIYRLWLMAAVVCVCLPLAGCGGCTNTPTNPNATPKTAEELEQERLDRATREQKEKAEAEKPDYELLALRTRPSTLATIDNSTKLGHWGSATVDARANREDFNGELQIEAVDIQGEPLTLSRTTYTLSTLRPVQLAKKQKKNLEITYFPPTGLPSFRLKSTLTFPFRGRPAGASTIDPINLMPAHQYHLLVLSGTPDAYAYLKAIPAVRAPSSHFTEAGVAPHYRVHAPQVRAYVPLASSSLKWTTVAYIVWDDFQPNKLQPSQQEALIDWLHWGGQLVISGPTSLDSLKTSFLDEYLPADASGARELDQTALNVLNTEFRHAGPELVVRRPWSGVQLAPRPGGQFIEGSNDLVVEGRVGAGRIVVTAFSLTQRDLRTWPGLDELTNAWLLKRDARVFTPPVGVEGATVAWKDTGSPFDPEKGSRVRFFTRDWLTVDARTKFVASQSVAEKGTDTVVTPYGQFNATPYGADIAPPTGPGVAGWNDFSDAAMLARKSLRDAAGIKVPKRDFVIWVLGTYVLVLAPLNWLLFRVIRRVEWAWMAVPVLAVGFSIGVIRLAQLDIGFARSTTELAVVEIQGAHPRAHMTRYTAMYSSLASTYDLEFSDPGALALPLAAEKELLTGQAIRPVTYWRDSTVRFTDFNVSSNSTGMVHSEHHVDLGGGLRWETQADGTWKLVNGTQYELKDAGIVGPRGVAWIGDLAPGAQATPDFVDRKQLAELSEEEEFAEGEAAEADDRDEQKNLYFSERESSPQTSRDIVAGKLSLHQLVELAEATAAPGETRLVAWTEEELPGLKIDPPAAQNRRLTLVVAHLDYGPLAAPQKDAMAWLDVVPAGDAHFADPNEGDDE